MEANYWRIILNSPPPLLQMVGGEVLSGAGLGQAAGDSGGGNWRHVVGQAVGAGSLTPTARLPSPLHPQAASIPPSHRFCPAKASGPNATCPPIKSLPCPTFPSTPILTFTPHQGLLHLIFSLGHGMWLQPSPITVVQSQPCCPSLGPEKQCQLCTTAAVGSSCSHAPGCSRDRTCWHRAKVKKNIAEEWREGEKQCGGLGGWGLWRRHRQPGGTQG